MKFRRLLLLGVFIPAYCKSVQSQGPAKPVAPAIADTARRADSTCPLVPVAAKPACPAMPVCEKAVCPAPAVQEKPVCPAPIVVEKKCTETDPPQPAGQYRIKSGLLFANAYEEKVFFDRMDLEHEKYGRPINVKHAKKKKFRGSLIEQRSGRRRLYDHNLFLRRLFAGKLVLRDHGNLSEQFEGAVFLDIGSAVLSDEGAVTVRDLFEDKKIAPHLTLVASDINDKASPKHRYIDIYRKQKKQLPFDVVEVSPLMTDAAKFKAPLEGHLTSPERPVMLRAANSGPDLYYDAKQLKKHLAAAIGAFEERNLIYFFNKFILYKPRTGNYFMVIAEIDETVGTNHKETPWEDIEWSTRRFDEGIFLNPVYW